MGSQGGSPKSPRGLPETVGRAMALLTKTQSALDHHAIVSVTDALGTITDVNERFCLISGYTREELIGSNHRILKSGEHAEPFYRTMWRALHRGQVWHGVICNRRKDGTPYWVQSTIVPLHDEQGELMECVSIRTDVTHLKLAQTPDRQRVVALLQACVELNTPHDQAQTTLLSSVFDLTEQCIGVADLAGQVIYTNQALERALGYSFEEIQRKPFWEFTAPRVRRQSRRALQAIERVDFHWHGLWPLQRKDGTILPSLSSIGVIANQEGAPQFVFDIFSDHEPELIQQEALRQAKEQAERTSEAKSSFLSAMSHELRTPMNAILGFAQLLQRDRTLTASQKRYANEIHSAGHHLLALINEVLDLAKVESGQARLTLACIDLDEVLAECLRLTQPLADQASLRLHPAAPSRATVQADRMRLKQILLNLLSNAIKYNRPHGEVSIQVLPIGADQLRIEVSDTGLGIAAHQLDRLFKPFTRLEGAHHHAQGTGIGLSICRGLAESMRGSVGVRSEEGMGSTFWLELPTTTQDFLTRDGAIS